MAKGKIVVSYSETNLLAIIDLINGSSITKTKLDGKSFLQWSAQIKTFIISKDKLKYIEEEQSDVSSSEWIRNDAQVYSKLSYYMEPHIAADVMLLAIWPSISEAYAANMNG